MQYCPSSLVTRKMKKREFSPFSITVHGRLVEFRRPIVMGILNVTDDSFYDGGRYRTPEAIISRAHQLIADGADIIDIGASSSRPGAILLPPDEEARRLQEAVTLVRQALPEAILSIDTCYSLPARIAIEAGADMINDIGGGQLDIEMYHTISDLQVPYILMHGASATNPHADIHPRDPNTLIDEITQFFSRQIDVLYTLGIKDLWIDPGFGFGKTMEENLDLLDHLDQLTTLFREPLLVGVSRKRMIYKTLNITPEEALNGTIALDTIALDRGARILRVHDPKPAIETIKLLYNIES